MLASHVGEVALRDKLHFFAPSLLPPTAAKGVHASLEVSTYARTLGVSKLYSFSPPRSLTLAEQDSILLQTGLVLLSVYYV